MNRREQLCAAQHFGYWLADPKWLNAAVAAYRSGDLRPETRLPTGKPAPAAEKGKLPKLVYAPGDDPRIDPPLYSVDTGSVAHISIEGQITKGRSSYGGTSSVRTRQALRRAEADSDVSGLLLSIDSPGGTVDGQGELGDEIYRVRRGPKPIHAHASGGMHSAALWAGAQAGYVTADPMTEIGSIGVVSTIHDLSGMYEKDGIKVHTVVSGDPDDTMKGAFFPGTEVTESQLAEVRDRVNALAGFFHEALKRGRGLPIAEVRAMSDGRDWLAADAKEKGLIDAVMSYDQALATLRRAIRERDAGREAKSRATHRRIKIAEMSSRFPLTGS